MSHLTSMKWAKRWMLWRSVFKSHVPFSFTFCILFSCDNVTITSLLPVDKSIHQSLSHSQIAWEKSVSPVDMCELIGKSHECQWWLCISLSRTSHQTEAWYRRWHAPVGFRERSWKTQSKGEMKTRKIESNDASLLCKVQKEYILEGKKLLLKPSIILKFERTL